MSCHGDEDMAETNHIRGLLLQAAATSGEAIDMEACFSQLTLDVIGKAVFNYDFNALTANSPLIQARRRLAGSLQTFDADRVPGNGMGAATSS